ncbi:transmembrane protein 26-like [Xenia sp. Carnegie-2017]|uniref:transmembrane protein 26-like n=1 Tax=Xenia sp. Carnegie-2017 TaxID=2897299 RepID=UPI001F03E945|nr:transmembrane protein 26-like [Xenia sp. Carnegie-2017]
MERIFTYLAAFLSRLVFVLHAFFLIWWLTQVKQDTSYWIFLVILSMLVIETSVTVFYRRGNEYYWFCPSIFIYTITEVPCFWLLRLQLVECVQKNTRIGITCSTNINGTNLFEEIFQASTNDESQLSILDQTFVLLLVVGRWMLPKGEITRDQLSSLLLVYIATAADIVELTEIYEDPAVGSNIRLVRAILIVWSMSLLQFSFTIMAVETRAKDRKELKEQLIKQADLREEERTFKVKSYQVAPALYSHKLAHKKAIERQKERLNNLQLKLKSDQKLDEISMENGQMNETNEKSNHKSVIQAFSKALTGFQEFVHRNLNLIQLLTPMLLQDGPFLIVRLLLVSYYKVKGSGTFLFLTAKNALLVTLQVYRICVLCCRPPEDEHDLFQEDEIVRLRNVQTAKKSVQKTNYVIRLVSRLQKKEEKSLPS